LTHDLRDILIWVPHSNPYPARVPLPTDAQKSRFLLQVHAPLDTNIVERALKLVIQVRKSSMFYKTLSSAAFASYVQSALYSAAQNEINQCEYMCALIENAQAVIQNPSAWLPWCFKQS